MAEITYLKVVPNEKDNIIQFENASSSITVTAMLYDEKIITLVFQVQSTNINKNEVESYIAKLNSIVAILVESEVECSSILFTETQTLTIPNATLVSTVEPKDIITMVPSSKMPTYLSATNE